MRALIGGGVDPVDPRPALHGVDRAGGAENQDRHAVAPGVEDRHRGVQQADVGMHRSGHRLAGDLGVAMRDRDRGLFVQAEQHLRLLVAEEVDDEVVQAPVARAGIERDIRNIERAQRLGDDVAAEGRRVGAVGNLKAARPCECRGREAVLDFGAIGADVQVRPAIHTSTGLEPTEHACGRGKCVRKRP